MDKKKSSGKTGEKRKTAAKSAGTAAKKTNGIKSTEKKASAARTSSNTGKKLSSASKTGRASGKSVRTTGKKSAGKKKSGKKGNEVRRQQVRTQKRILALLLFLVVLIGCLMIVRLGRNVQKQPETPVEIDEKRSINAQVESYRSQVQTIAQEYGVEEYTDLILALMMQESSGIGRDVLQSSECGYNTEYPQEPGGITDPEYSIRCGIQELKFALEKAEVSGPEDLDRIAMALQAYNFGTVSYLNYMKEHGESIWTRESAEAFAQWASNETERSEYDPYRENAGPWNYGDQRYPEHVLRYYPVGLDGEN